jgi:hypothetical protein
MPQTLCEACHSSEARTGNDQSSVSPSVMISVSLQLGHLPVPLQFGQFSWSELRATFWPVPKQRWQSPVPPQSAQRRSAASPSNTDGYSLTYSTSMPARWLGPSPALRVHCEPCSSW